MYKLDECPSLNSRHQWTHSDQIWYW